VLSFSFRISSFSRLLILTSGLSEFVVKEMSKGERGCKFLARFASRLLDLVDV
jgi:hypothetical protein